jgi:hypothetical protein
MSKKSAIVLIYHRHKLSDLIISTFLNNSSRIKIWEKLCANRVTVQKKNYLVSDNYASASVKAMYYVTKDIEQNKWIWYNYIREKERSCYSLLCYDNM